MPIVRVAMLKGKSPEYIGTMLDSISTALVDAYEMPNEDRFQIAIHSIHPAQADHTHE